MCIDIINQTLTKIFVSDIANIVKDYYDYKNHTLYLSIYLNYLINNYKNDEFVQKLYNSCKGEYSFSINDMQYILMRYIFQDSFLYKLTIEHSNKIINAGEKSVLIYISSVQLVNLLNQFNEAI